MDRRRFNIHAAVLLVAAALPKLAFAQDDAKRRAEEQKAKAEQKNKPEEQKAKAEGKAKAEEQKKKKRGDLFYFDKSFRQEHLRKRFAALQRICQLLG